MSTTEAMETVNTDPNESKDSVVSESTESAAPANAMPEAVPYEEFVKLKQTHERVLEEAKKSKRGYQEIKKQSDADKRARDLAQGKYKETCEAQAKEIEELKASRIRDKVNTAVTAAAAKAGCVDVDALLRLGNPELLHFDEATGQVEDENLFIEDAKRRKPYLFSQTRPAVVNPTVPSGAVETQRTLTAADVVKIKDQKTKDQIWMNAFANQSKK